MRLSVWTQRDRPLTAMRCNGKVYQDRGDGFFATTELRLRSFSYMPPATRAEGAGDEGRRLRGAEVVDLS